MRRGGTHGFSRFWIVFFWIWTTVLFGQTATEESLLEGLEDKAASEMMEVLELLRQHPVDLNTATSSQLGIVPILSSSLARQILREREKGGLFQSWDDVLKRLDLEPDLAEYLAPYVTIVKEKYWHAADVRSRWRLQQTLPDTKGFTSNTYAGSSWKLFQKLIWTQGKNWRSSLLTEKDPGEASWHDHITGFIESRFLSGNARVVAGSYRAEMGQGLVLWGPYGLGKGAELAAPVQKRSRGAVGYASAGESGNLFGCAAELKTGAFQFTLLASRVRQDAHVRDDGTVSSLYESGLHRTPNEIEKRNRMAESLWGGRIARVTEHLTIGVTAWWNETSRIIDSDATAEDAFLYRGDRQHVAGLDWNFSITGLNVFGEAARTRSGACAWISSAIMDLNRIALVVSIRRFDADFHNPHSHSFGSTAVRSEEGAYIGLKAKICAATTLRFFWDLARIPWRSCHIASPKIKDDLFLQIDQKVTHALTLLVRLRIRRNAESVIADTPWGIAYPHLAQTTNRQIRFQLTFRPTPRIQLRNRIETVLFNEPSITGQLDRTAQNNTGLWLCQDINWRPHPSLTVRGRWGHFDAMTYNARIYAFESDLPGVLTIRPFYGRGIRWYLIFRWHPTQAIHLTAKMGQISHENVDSWGSGYDQRIGDTQTDIGLGLDIRF